jgi:hypothetical protein
MMVSLTCESFVVAYIASLDSDILGRIDADLDLSPIYCEHSDKDLVANPDTFILATADNEHDLYLLGRGL